ncbi:MAG: hypothetical protein KZQ92_18830 [Candidatus Thiodiazotropha sp. (ex Lucinoma borealis)]|nr:hypothetical protein [Candidatus Thiodiazotropha sp. (ex Lucinoma borealis)]
MTDLEEVRKRWLNERHDYERFGLALSDRLRKELRQAGIWAEVSSRAKEIDSLIRKLIKKPGRSYESIGDKSGVRVILRYKDEIEPVLKLADEAFECGELEHKADTLKHDQVGYLSVHVDVKLLADDPLAKEYPPVGFRAELQVRTLAQHLWSEMSHDAFYKNDEILNPLPVQVKRRVYLLAGVVEVADDEFNRLNAEIPILPELQLLNSLESHYFKLTSRRSDPELSLDVIRLLMPLYDSEIPKIISHLDAFYNNHQEVIRHVYEDAENTHDRSVYIFQPEALMIYDRLSTDVIGIQKVWNTKYPERELERIANAFGISFD